MVDSAGLVSAVDNGAATITARAGEASGDAHVTVEIDLDRVALVATLQRDRRSELGRQHQLADGRAAGRVVWGLCGRARPGGRARSERDMGP